MSYMSKFPVHGTLIFVCSRFVHDKRRSHDPSGRIVVLTKLVQLVARGSVPVYAFWYAQ